jgi:hypothetical protein
MGDKSPLTGDQFNSLLFAESMISVPYDTPLLAAE